MVPTVLTVRFSSIVARTSRPNQFGIGTVSTISSLAPQHLSTSAPLLKHRSTTARQHRSTTRVR